MNTSRDIEVDLSDEVDMTDVPDETDETADPRVPNGNGHRADRQELQQHAEQLKRIKARREEVSSKVSQYTETKERVKHQPADCQIVQTMAGGIQFEVPFDRDDAYSRDDLLDEIDDMLEKLDEYDAKLAEQEQKLEQALEPYRNTGTDEETTPQSLEAVNQPYSSEQPR